jgi:hypothetical protein
VSLSSGIDVGTPILDSCTLSSTHALVTSMLTSSQAPTVICQMSEAQLLVGMAPLELVL